MTDLLMLGIEMEGEIIMAKVICSMNCKYRSKRPLRNYRYKSGERCYGCVLDVINISRMFDPDLYIVEVVGEENMARCSKYEPLEENDTKRSS